MSQNVSSDYAYHDAETTWALSYLWGPLKQILATRFAQPASLFELGCGNGSTANRLHELGWKVAGVDPSTTGIEMANRHFPELRFFPHPWLLPLSSPYIPSVISESLCSHPMVDSNTPLNPAAFNATTISEAILTHSRTLSGARCRRVTSSSGI